MVVIHHVKYQPKISNKKTSFCILNHALVINSSDTKTTPLINTYSYPGNDRVCFVRQFVFCYRNVLYTQQ